MSLNNSNSVIDALLESDVSRLATWTTNIPTRIKKNNHKKNPLF